jgi:putative pre-16S rRNA nuclease
VRVVAFDVGERRIGVAVSDVTLTLARPETVLQPTSLASDALQLAVDEITRLKSEEDGVTTIVVGLPRRLDGSDTELTARVSAFASDLGRITRLPIVLQDERLTSREAESRLALTEKDWRVRKRRLDAAAAAIILQDYLDARHQSSVPAVPDI